METKLCPICKEVKALNEFNSQGKYCLVCHREKGKIWRLKNPKKNAIAQKKYTKTRNGKLKQKTAAHNHYIRHKETVIARAHEVQKKIKEEFVTYKKTLTCSRCPESDYRCLHFHHIRDKKYNISSMLPMGFRMKRIMEEVAKCIVLCANCHAKEHYYTDNQSEPSK